MQIFKLKCVLEIHVRVWPMLKQTCWTGAQELFCTPAVWRGAPDYFLQPWAAGENPKLTILAFLVRSFHLSKTQKNRHLKHFDSLIGAALTRPGIKVCREASGLPIYFHIISTMTAKNLQHSHRGLSLIINVMGKVTNNYCIVLLYSCWPEETVRCPPINHLGKKR